MTVIRRQRHYRQYHLPRGTTFGPAVLAPLAGWGYLGEPLHWAGLGVMLAAGLLVIPAAVLVVMFFLPAMIMSGLIPRRRRARHRQRLIEDGVPRNAQRSSYISASLRRVVLAADRNRCSYCGARLHIHVAWLEVDHMVAWSGGGLTTLFNCRALCQPCNGVKLNYSVDRDGYIHYRGYKGLRAGQALPRVVLDAADILRAERRGRWNPLRLWRAAWALG